MEDKQSEHLNEELNVLNFLSNHLSQEVSKLQSLREGQDKVRVLRNLITLLPQIRKEVKSLEIQRDVLLTAVENIEKDFYEREERVKRDHAKFMVDMQKKQEEYITSKEEEKRDINDAIDILIKKEGEEYQKFEDISVKLNKEIEIKKNELNSLSQKYEEINRKIKEQLEALR